MPAATSVRSYILTHETARAALGVHRPPLQPVVPANFKHSFWDPLFWPLQLLCLPWPFHCWPCQQWPLHLLSFYRKPPWRHQQPRLLKPLFLISWTYSNQTVIPSNPLVINKFSCDLHATKSSRNAHSLTQSIPRAPCEHFLTWLSFPTLLLPHPLTMWTFLPDAVSSSPPWSLHGVPWAQSSVFFFISTHVYSPVSLTVLQL